MATAVLNSLPETYVELSEQELDERITRAKAALGPRLVILGHHYQRDEVVKFSDYRGDSLKLSQQAAARKEAEYIVFCGVHFMAESADILSGDHQTVVLPDLNAGCSMADMADLEQVEVCWDEIAGGTDAKVVPVTYINSTAAIKGFVGEHGGAVCTSSNARKVMEWAFGRGDKGLFLPDEHLGRNTGYRMGIPLDEMVVWNPHEELGRLERRPSQGRARLSLEGPLLRASAVPAGACREGACKVSRYPRYRSPGMPLGRLRARRRSRLDGVHHQARQGVARGNRMGGGN